MTVEMDTERTRARHRDKTQDVFAEESEALDQIAKQVNINRNSDTGTVNINFELDLAFNNVKPMDWYFVLDKVRFRTGLGRVRLIT